MVDREPAAAAGAAAPKRRRVQLRARSWVITLNDRDDYPPSARWREEAQARAEAEEDGRRAHAAAAGADEEEEAEQGPVADAGAAGPDVGDRVGHFRHPTEVVDGLRGASHLSYFVGQLERGSKEGKLANCLSLGCIAQTELVRLRYPAHLPCRR